jgi:hypothetical protein
MIKIGVKISNNKHLKIEGVVYDGLYIYAVAKL